MAAEKPTRVRDLSPRARLEAEQAIMRRYPGTMLALIPASIAIGFLVLALMPPLPLQPRKLNAGQVASLEPKGMPMRRPLPFWSFRSAQRDEQAGRGELDRCGAGGSAYRGADRSLEKVIITVSRSSFGLAINLTQLVSTSDQCVASPRIAVKLEFCGQQRRRAPCCPPRAVRR